MTPARALLFLPRVLIGAVAFTFLAGYHCCLWVAVGMDWVEGKP